MNSNPSLGIDIDKMKFVAGVWLTPQRCLKAEFANHAGGFRKLRMWLKQHGLGSLRVGIESTNVYGEALAQWLYDQGHEVFVLNPEHVAHYARSRGQRNKTDPADAATIAAFIAHHEATPWRPPSPEQKTLRSLTRTRYQLVQLGQQLSNQIRTAQPAGRKHLQLALRTIRTQLAAIGKEITAHLRIHPVLYDQVRRVMTIKGIGLITAATAIAELPPITPQSEARAICAWAGLTPHRRQSGRTELPAHLCRKGNVYLRQALFMPALVAKRYNPLLRDFAQRLAAKGKRTPAILGAISHKMLRIIVGLLRSNTNFNPNWHLEKI